MTTRKGKASRPKRNPFSVENQNGLQHHARVTADAATIEAVQRDGWTDPVGGIDAAGNCFVDPRLPRGRGQVVMRGRR